MAGHLHSSDGHPVPVRSCTPAPTGLCEARAPRSRNGPALPSPIRHAAFAPHQDCRAGGRDENPDPPATERATRSPPQPTKRSAPCIKRTNCRLRAACLSALVLQSCERAETWRLGAETTMSNGPRCYLETCRQRRLPVRSRSSIDSSSSTLIC